MKHVTLYTQPDCPPCEVVKLFMKEYKIEYIEKNIKEDNEARDYLIKQLKAYSTPTITVDDTVITGFDLDGLKAALEI
ncbi:NrdH-redoxin [[Bacillus] enclensis]|uniref:Glutaredoxin-like protein, YruB-family n=2 Tax=Rossellomorea TaxID=2837508 RepID=A0A0V8HI83_9BACI|nr:glutaredoxin family protein [[Bacillus] enclensis]OAT83285.1 NrdH-redoxin [Bacillus sp. MKU004]QTC42234.1 glutaredoxin family protein [Bacillus sp. V3]QWC24299.1 glutaredoxin family protein [Bacillus haikouensis]KSU62339.1 NrdH-redoxin [[Bacillus] enclensis]SCC02957.1 Glutaredoxin-like protein, YruB-family [[Bacillus] enclensis]